MKSEQRNVKRFGCRAGASNTRAACGPRVRFVWTAMLFQNVEKINIYVISFFTGVWKCSAREWASSPLNKGWPKYVPRAVSFPPTSLIRPAKYLEHFFQAPRFRVWTAGQQHWRLLTCQLQQHLAASRARKSKKLVWSIVIIVLQCILTTCFWIDYVNPTVSGPPVARQTRIRSSGQNVCPPLLWTNVEAAGNDLPVTPHTLNRK